MRDSFTSLRWLLGEGSKKKETMTLKKLFQKLKNTAFLEANCSSSTGGVPDVNPTPTVAAVDPEKVTVSLLPHSISHPWGPPTSP